MTTDDSSRLLRHSLSHSRRHLPSKPPRSSRSYRASLPPSPLPPPPSSELTIAELRKQVTRILFSTSSPPRAIGVEFTSLEKPYPSLPNLVAGKEENRKLYRAVANKEVILTAGVFGSAQVSCLTRCGARSEEKTKGRRELTRRGREQILKVSGVGPRAELERAGVQVVVDLPAVGTHLKDHLSVGMSFV